MAKQKIDLDRYLSSASDVIEAGLGDLWDDNHGQRARNL